MQRQRFLTICAMFIWAFVCFGSNNKEDSLVLHRIFTFKQNNEQDVKGTSMNVYTRHHVSTIKRNKLLIIVNQNRRGDSRILPPLFCWCRSLVIFDIFVIFDDPCRDSVGLKQVWSALAAPSVVAGCKDRAIFRILFKKSKKKHVFNTD